MRNKGTYGDAYRRVGKDDPRVDKIVLELRLEYEAENADEVEELTELARLLQEDNSLEARIGIFAMGRDCNPPRGFVH